MRKQNISPLYDDEISEVNKTINKMLQIQDILLHYEKQDKKLKKGNYLIDYFLILQMIEQENVNYSDKEIIARVNNLYDKIFKSRRY